MWNRTSHLSDEELLLWVDGELQRRHAMKARAHLSACWDCRSRMAQIESTIHEFMQAHRASLPELPPGAGPRALLKAWLAELSIGKYDSPQHPQRRVPWGWAAAACLAVLVMGGTLLHKRSVAIQSNPRLAASFLPDPRLTPGAALDVDISHVCAAPHDDVIRSVPSALQDSVLREYGVPVARAGSFEIDFLISPGLGGAEDMRNLWPQPHSGMLWNSFAKDQLEDYLHQSVCSGRIGLQTAQRDIAIDWVSAYQKYFHTSKPLRATSGFGVKATSRMGLSRFRGLTSEAFDWRNRKISNGRLWPRIRDFAIGSEL